MGQPSTIVASIDVEAKFGLLMLTVCAPPSRVGHPTFIRAVFQRKHRQAVCMKTQHQNLFTAECHVRRPCIFMHILLYLFIFSISKLILILFGAAQVAFRALRGGDGGGHSPASSLDSARCAAGTGAGIPPRRQAVLGGTHSTPHGHKPRLEGKSGDGESSPRHRPLPDRARQPLLGIPVHVLLFIIVLIIGTDHACRRRASGFRSTGRSGLSSLLSSGRVTTPERAEGGAGPPTARSHDHGRDVRSGGDVVHAALACPAEWGPALRVVPRFAARCRGRHRAVASPRLLNITP